MDMDKIDRLVELLGSIAESAPGAKEKLSTAVYTPFWYLRDCNLKATFTSLRVLQSVESLLLTAPLKGNGEKEFWLSPSTIHSQVAELNDTLEDLLIELATENCKCEFRG